MTRLNNTKKILKSKIRVGRGIGSGKGKTSAYWGCFRKKRQAKRTKRKIKR